MMHVLVRHKVSDFNRWKEAFDSHLTARKRAGETGFRMFHSVDDPREVVLLLDWQTRGRSAKVHDFRGTAERHAESRRGRISRSPVTLKTCAPYIALRPTRFPTPSSCWKSFSKLS